jgi:formylglycine-generating enzyme
MRRVRRRAIVAALLVVLPATTLVAACQIVDGLGSIVYSEGGTEAARPDGRVDASRGFDFDARATAMVAVSALFCIDSTEVTFAQFMEWSQDADLPEGGPCRGLSPPDFQSTASPETPADSPVTLVPWCAADQYCAAHGRALCSTAEWIAACRGTSSTAYPYGATFEAGVCNVDSGGPGPVPWNDGSCQGGDPGIYDMIGNVAEWTSGCTPSLGCAVLGGGYEAGETPCPDVIQVLDSFRIHATIKTPEIGFRCCAPTVLGKCPE